MASTTALFTGLSGLQTYARQLDVVGNNITNANTVGFKKSRLVLESELPISIGAGAPPGDGFGGTNPTQIGLGVRGVSTQRDFRTGSVSPTGDPRDLAIEGSGFFVVQRGEDQFFTRNGGFRLDNNQQLVTPGGEVLLGFGVDENFNIQQGALNPLELPIGRQSITEATTRVAIAGNLDSGASPGQTGGLTELRPTATGGFTLIPAAAAGVAPDSILGTSLLTEIADPNSGIPDTPLFTAGQSIEISGAERGDRTVAAQELEITDATTVDDLLAFLNTVRGIHTTDEKNPDGTEPGATIDPATGVISITGNTGAQSDIRLDNGDIRLINEDGSLAGTPLVANDLADADGESVRTTLSAFDSLGNLVTFEIAFTLESKNGGGQGTTWRYDIFSDDNEGGDAFIQTGTIDFDANGLPVEPQPIQISLGRAESGADDPLTFELDFAGADGGLTSLAGAESQFSGVERDGLPPGTLESFSVDPAGNVIGIYGNGAARTLGQVPTADFVNPAGLVDVGGGLFQPGGNSGEPVIAPPGTNGTGELRPGALELSNVDLGESFVELILVNTAYSASSRIIQTADELIQQLLLIGR